MKKVIWYLMIVFVGVLACNSQSLQPEMVNFEFNGESTGNASFSVSQLTSDKKAILIISTDPMKLKITTKEQTYDLKNYTRLIIYIDIHVLMNNFEDYICQLNKDMIYRLVANYLF